MEEQTISHSTMDTTLPASSFSTLPIRAPLTLDSDSEYSNSTQCQNDENGTYNNSNNASCSSNGSDVSEFETEGCFSGEDEVERTFVADPNDFASDHVGFRPFVKYPHGKNNENSAYNNNNNVSSRSGNGSDVNEFGTEGFSSGESEFERPFVDDPGDDSQEKCDFVSDHVGFRPFVSYPNGKNNEYHVSWAYLDSTRVEGTSVSSRNEDFKENDGFVENGVETDGETGENGGCRAYVFGTNGESIKSIEGDRYGNLGTGTGGDFVGNGDLARNCVGKSNELGVSRAFVFGTTGERASVKSVEGDKYGDFGPSPDGDFVGNGDYVHNHVGKRNEFKVSRAYVSGTSKECTCMNLIVEGKIENFGFEPNDNLNENGNSVEDAIIIRPFPNGPCGKINEMGISLAYVDDTDGKETSVEPTRECKCGAFSELSVVDIGISEIQNLSIPIAKLSRDSDEESLVYENVEDNEFWGDVRVPDSGDTHSIEMTENTISDKVCADEELEEENGSEFKIELDDQLFEKLKMNENVVENMELQSGVVAGGHGYTCSFVDEMKDTILTKVMEESDNVVIACDNFNGLIDGTKNLNLVVIDSADLMKMDNLGEETRDGPRRSYDNFGPLLMSTSKMNSEDSYDVSSPLLLSSLDFEFTGKLEDQKGYDTGNSEGSFSLDDYSNGSLLKHIEQTFCLNVLKESSKDFWPKTESILTGHFNEKDDTHEESEAKKVFDQDTSANSPRQNFSEEQNKNIDTIKLLQGKFSKLVQRLGLSLEDPIASHVLYRLILLEKELSNSLYTFEAALKTGIGLEWESGKADVDLSLNILVIGKTGVGKSATINSIFGKEKAYVNAFEPATTNVKELIGTIDGIKLRIFDTPGLKSSAKEQSFNMKVLSSAKRLIRKHPLDIVLYVDRLDMETRDLTDSPLLMSISKCLGSSIWQKTVITLTHAGSIQPDGPNGSPLSYDLHVAQKSRTIQLMISQSLGCSELNFRAVSSVSLVENHSSSTEMVNGENLLLNGEKWRAKLLLLCSSLKTLYEANLVRRNQDLFYDHKFSGAKTGFLQIPHFLSSLLYVNSHWKTPEPGGALSASDQEDEDEDENDQLLCLKPSTKTLVKNKCLSDGLDHSLVNLPVIKWRGGIEWGGNLQSQFSLGRGSKLVLRAGLNDKLNGQVSVKIRGSEQLQFVLLCCFSMVDAIGRNYF